MEDIAEIIKAMIAIVLVIILARAFYDVIIKINPSMVIIFIFAVIVIIAAILKEVFK